jgi:hypothetical protein
MPKAFPEYLRRDVVPVAPATGDPDAPDRFGLRDLRVVSLIAEPNESTEAGEDPIAGAWHSKITLNTGGLSTDR